MPTSVTATGATTTGARERRGAPLAAAGALVNGRPATIEMVGVSKWYGDKVALSDVTFALGPGVTALLGANGAGKSTTLKLLTGQLRPSRGEVRVLGQPVVANPALYRQIGVVPEQEGLYPFLTAREFIELSARLCHLPDPRAAARTALETVDLLDVADRRLGAFSKGMRQRAKIAQALVHDPAVLFLDEPLSGADPRQRIAIMQIFSALGAAGKTVLISSHILYEVERMGSNVLVMVNGKLAAEGDYHAIRALMDDRPRRVRVTCSDAQKLAQALVVAPGVTSVALEAQALVVETTAPLAFHQAVPRAAQQANIRLYAIEGLDEDLETVFRYLVSGEQN
jgi:ABC-2 type transport system ATP-binding protein